MSVTRSTPMASTIDRAMVVFPEPEPPAIPMVNGPAVGHEGGDGGIAVRVPGRGCGECAAV